MRVASNSSSGVGKGPQLDQTASNATDGELNEYSNRRDSLQGRSPKEIVTKRRTSMMSRKISLEANSLIAPAHAACRTGDCLTVTELLQHAEGGCCKLDAEGRSGFHFAAANWRRETLELLCNTESTEVTSLVDAKDAKGRTPLQYVMLHKKVWKEIDFEYVLQMSKIKNWVQGGGKELGPRRRRRRRSGRFTGKVERGFAEAVKTWTVEREAAITVDEQEESCSCLRVLLAAGADINRKTKDLDTVLHYACSASNVKACALLLASGATLAADSNARSPLHISAWAGSVGCIEGTLTQSVYLFLKTDQYFLSWVS